MIESAVAYIQTLISAHGAWGVFLATIIEEAVAPIPSSLVPLAGGFFLLPADHILMQVAVEALILVAIPVTLGVTIGSSIVYWIAYAGGKPIVDRFGKYVGLSWKAVEGIEARMTKGRRDEVTLFALRLMPVIPGVALSGFCGALRYPFARFAVITFVASGIRAYGLALLGWQAGELYTRYIDMVSEYEDTLLLILFVAVLAAVFIHFARAHRKR